MTYPSDDALHKEAFRLQEARAARLAFKNRDDPPCDHIVRVGATCHICDLEDRVQELIADRDSWRVAYGEKQALLVVFEAALIEIARGAPQPAALAKRVLEEAFPPVTDPSQPPAA